MADDSIIYYGSIYGKHKQGYIGSVYDTGGICPTILTNSITANKLMILVVEEDERRDNLQSDRSDGSHD